MKKQLTNSLNLLTNVALLLAVLGCKTLSRLGGKTSSDDKYQTNSSTIDRTKTGGGLADEIVGTWEMQDRDKTRFTFGKNGTLVVKQEEAAAQTATYSVLDADAIEVRAEGKPKLVIIIKITGDTMVMNTQNRGKETLKRIS